ncbi:MAG: DUF1616 domain-containing protein [Thermoprotei archaeon]|jgi:uncharacterized membrane protein
MSWIFDEEVLAVIIAIVIVAAVLATTQIINSGRVTEPFSALGLLNQNAKIGDYPKEVIAGTSFQLNIYIENYEGKTMYYKILVKIGNKTSIINGTTPLNTQPILELRRVLPHNTSTIIPVNITLYQPTTNLRLVFEMWILNETTQNFTYYGRWNQLWLNVTKPSALITTPSQSQITINPDIDNKLTQAYLSIRRAENAGGNVTQIIQLLNKAIYYAQNGNNTEVNNLVNQILTLEPQITKIGQQTQTIRLYMTTGIITSILIIIIASYIYLRHRIWLYWTKLHKNWKITWIADTNTKLNPIQKRIKDMLKNNKQTTITIENILSSSIGYKTHEVAKTLYIMTKTNMIKLIDPNPPTTFTKYLHSRYNSGFIIATILLALAIISVYTSQISIIITIIRYILGTLLVLFLPGYALIEALYPKEEDLKPLERLALSIGLSLALVPLVGLILNYTPWGIRLGPILTALTILTLTLLITSTYRKYDYLKLKVMTTHV